MPKESWNIIDFSGGFNSLNNKRDLENNESAFITDLISYKKGTLKLEGVFAVPEDTGLIEGFWPEDYSIGSNVNFYLQPGYHFVVYGKAEANTSGSSTTVTMTSTSHGLRTGSKITIIKTPSGSTEYIGSEFEVTVDHSEHTGFDRFTIELLTADTISGQNWYYVIGADYVERTTFTPESVEAWTGAGRNKLILRNDGFEKFGFYDVEGKTFYGSKRTSDDVEQFLGTDSWFFDTRYLWNFNQAGTDHPEIIVGTSPSDATQYNNKVSTAFYIDGVFRVQVQVPKYFLHGYFSRPVGLYYIEKHDKFSDFNRYYRGWYPISSHILSPTDYRKDFGWSDNFNKSGGKIISTGAAVGDIDMPLNIHQVNVGLEEVSEIGDWQLNGIHTDLQIGISLVYDSPDFKNPISFAQESNISQLTTDNGIASNDNQGANKKVTISGGGANVKLKLGFKIKLGTFEASDIQNQLFSETNAGISESRGSRLNNGFSNFNAWNPRIKAINFYMMGNSGSGTLGDPILMHTIVVAPESLNFTIDDGNTYAYGSVILISVPEVFKYEEILHGYHHNETINMWYKTSTIVNRRLYAGNISYLTMGHKVPAELSAEYPLVSQPDWIVWSPVNKFDILPRKNRLMIAALDGQDIVKLESYQNSLLVYKTTDLFILDASTEQPILTNTLYGKGVLNPNHVAKSENFIFSMNKTGVYAFDGEGIQNITLNKMDPEFFKQNIYKSDSHLLYDPQQNLLLVTTNYDTTGAHTQNTLNKALIINLTTGGLFYKNNLTTTSIYNISNQMHIDGELYITVSNTAAEESFVSLQTTSIVLGEQAEAYVKIGTNATGTNPTIGGGTCTAGQLSTDVQYVKVKRASDNKWVLVNDALIGFSDINYPKQKGSPSAGKVNYDNLVALRDYILSNLNYDSAVDDEYYFKDCYINGEANSSSATLTMLISSRKFGASYSFTEEDITSISSTYGTTAIAFANDASENTNPGSAGIGIGNINSYSYTEVNTGVNPTAAVWTIQVDRNDNENLYSYYYIQTISGNHTSEINTFIYIVGLDYWVNDSSYSYTEPTSDDNDVNNDNLLANIRNGLLTGKFISSENGQIWDNNAFVISAIDTSGGSGSHKFTITLGDSIMNDPFAYPETYDIITSVSDPYTNTGAILKWSNFLPKDLNNNSLYTSSSIDLQTKDIDFEEPNIRKKVYSAYITYTGGDGQIICQYQANQSGSWTDAVVYDADGTVSTTAGQLNSSSSPTRAQLKFGTGGNNVYSFALRFKSVASVSIFEINDLSIMYRLKNPK